MKRFLTTLGILMVLSGAAYAADLSETLTLTQAIQIAITHNLQFKAAQAQLGVSEAEIGTAKARLNPSLVSDNGIAEKTYRVGIEQTIELGNKRRKRISLAQAEREVILSTLNTRLLDLRSEVRRAYTQAYNAQERQHNSENILQVTQELLSIARKREKAGDISQLDVLQTEIVTVNAQNDLQSVVQDVLTSRNRLNALLNLPFNTAINLTPPSITPQLATASMPAISPHAGSVLQGSVNQMDSNLEGLIDEAYRRRPEMQQASHNLEVTQRQIALARANRIPNLTLAAGPDIVTGSSSKAFNAFITGNLELPVFNRQQGPIREALARKLQLEQEQAALKSQIALEVTNAYTAFQMNQERIKRYETQLLPYSVAVVDKSRLAFQEGKTPILTPINAQQAYINTRIGYLQAVMDLQNAISDLERAVGTGL